MYPKIALLTNRRVGQERRLLEDYLGGSPGVREEGCTFAAQGPTNHLEPPDIDRISSGAKTGSLEWGRGQSNP
jgi:hypothetical protein